MSRNRYGKTVKEVQMGLAEGLTMKQLVEKTGTSYHALHCCAKRIGAKLARTKGHIGYGDGKEIIYKASEEGLTYLQASLKYNIPRWKLYNAAKSHRVYLKPSKHTK